LLRLVNVGFNAVINFINGLADAIRKHSPRLRAAGRNLAGAIIEGMLGGLGDGAEKLYKKAKHIAGHTLHIMSHPWEAFSPSRVMQRLGKNIVLGLATGIDKHAPTAYKSAQSLTDSLKDSMLGSHIALDNMKLTQPVIAPVLDLSRVKKEAPKIGDMMAIDPLLPIASTAHAAAIAKLTPKSVVLTGAQVPTTSVKFEQHNHSPDPLSNIEIYRQTNNQISQIKSLGRLPTV
jgi:hypothetical protein